MNNTLRHQCLFATNEDQIKMNPNDLGKRGLEKSNAVDNPVFEMEQKHEYFSKQRPTIGFEQFSGRSTDRKKSVIDVVGRTPLTPIAMHFNSRWNDYCTKRRAEKNKATVHRKGPAPIDGTENLKKAVSKSTYGTLDSDVEEIDNEENRVKNNPVRSAGRPNLRPRKDGSSLASCRALIIYFSKLAKTNNEEEHVDLNFVESLLQSGADINFADKHGQTIMHEISRAWHPDVALFAIQHNINVNKRDVFGRTPLHLAAAFDYDEMVEFLLQHGGDMNAVTEGENQTPMHYAAKNNATASLKSLLKFGAHINARDYKMRTPLFVASEAARPEAAQFLMEHGAPVGVYDDSGTPCLSLMIEKMPNIAIEAVEQFHSIDRAFRKHYFYLSYLEKDSKYLEDIEPIKKREKQEKKEKQNELKKELKEKGIKMPKPKKTFAKLPIEVILQCNQLDLIMHPVFQKLLQVKWNLFGKWGTFGLVIVNFLYTLIWTVLGIFLPRQGESFYTPMSSNWWRLLLEIIGLLLTAYFIVSEVRQFRFEERNYNQWRQWRTRQIERDIEFCHPRWPEEREYLQSELEQVRTYQRTYFKQPWNIFEWITYLVIIILAITRIMAVVSSGSIDYEIHPHTYAIGLIFIWLRLIRSFRAFRSLGPFIAILGSVIYDTLKFAFLFFDFFIPYAVAFWILFGGSKHGKLMGTNSVDWQNFNDLVFSVWKMTLIGDFNWDGLVAVHRLIAQFLVGTYFAIAGVVCMNLYIALLSDTFSRVYARAQANAVMQQAHIILLVEKSLSKKKKVGFRHYMKNECGPLEVYSRDDGSSQNDYESGIFEKVVRQISNRIDELEDKIKPTFSSNQKEDGRRVRGNSSRSASVGGVCDDGGGDDPSGGGRDFDHYFHLIDTQNRQLGMVEQKVDELQQLMLHFLNMTPTHSIPSHISRLPGNISARPPQMPNTLWSMSNQEVGRVQIPATHDRERQQLQQQQYQQHHHQQQQQQHKQQQQQQHFIAHGNNFFESLQPQDGQSQCSDNRSRLSDSYPQSEERSGQRNEFDQDHDLSSNQQLLRIELTTEPDISAPDTSV